MRGVTARGKTCHQGLEGGSAYRPRLLGRGSVQGVQLYGNYVYVDARIREAGLNKGL